MFFLWYLFRCVDIPAQQYIDNFLFIFIDSSPGLRDIYGREGFH